MRKIFPFSRVFFLPSPRLRVIRTRSFFSVSPSVEAFGFSNGGIDSSHDNFPCARRWLIEFLALSKFLRFSSSQTHPTEREERSCRVEIDENKLKRWTFGFPDRKTLPVWPWDFLLPLSQLVLWVNIIPTIKETSKLLSALSALPIKKLSRPERSPTKVHNLATCIWHLCVL